MLRSTSRLVSSRINRLPVTQISISNFRSISSSPINLDGASKQGMGEKVTVEEKNPITARAETAKNAAKSVADGVKGIAKKATGNGEASTDAMDAAGKDPIEQQVERGRKAGLDKKPEGAGN
ncbi:hypothetical protein JCM5350_007490 [Sporobolomyces pararoseus]